jgi:hypothetical protein
VTFQQTNALENIPIQLCDYSLEEALSSGDISVNELKKYLESSTLNVVVETSPKLAATVLDKFSGQRLYIGRRGNTVCRIAKVIGEENYEALVGLLEYEDFEVPKADQLRRILRNKKIFLMRSDGMSATYIASRFSLSCRQVFSIYGKDPDNAKYEKKRGERENVVI